MEPKITLSKHPKIDTGFTVPEDYFDHFPDQVFKKIPVTTVKVVPFKRNNRLWYFVAASFVVGLTLLPYYWWEQNTLQEVDSSTIENYLAYQAMVSEDEIVNFLDENDLEKMKIDLDISNNDLEKILEETPNIEQYLID